MKPSHMNIKIKLIVSINGLHLFCKVLFESICLRNRRYCYFMIHVLLQKHWWKFGRTRNDELQVNIFFLPNFHECCHNLIKTDNERLYLQSQLGNHTNGQLSSQGLSSCCPLEQEEERPWEWGWPTAKTKFKEKEIKARKDSANTR